MKYPHPKYPKFAFWWTSVKYSLIYFMTSGYLSLNGWIEISKTKTVTHLPLFMSIIYQAYHSKNTIHYEFRCC